MPATKQVNSAKRILKVTVKRMLDENPDTSWLGEYSDTCKSEFSIDRKHSLDCLMNCRDGRDTPSDECDCEERGDMERREFRYFNPSFHHVGKDGHALKENTPEEVRKYVRQDYERMESLNAGQWSFIGIAAEAEVWNPVSQVVQRIHSGGLWGIESDGGEEHIKEEETNQLSELRRELLDYGFRTRAINKAFQAVEHKDA